ncbi:hypothetical protein EV128_116147 [Rhizobium azibense]|nr:hypothetical protein EV128_116147 [Rhizobium azibense]
MYVRVKKSDRLVDRDKLRVLLVLQGAHHLELYEGIFRYCPQFEWYCLLPELPNERQIQKMHFRYGIRFFTDAFACLAHFANFDVVVTTWAVPHRKHLPYLKFIALAHELSLPVFELQHGLFQIGLTYEEDSPVIGSRAGAAIAAPNVGNFTSRVLGWAGESGIGYPRSPAFEGRENQRPPCGCERVVFVTNHHWGLLSDTERQNCYNIMYDTIRTLSAVDFVLLPHGGELKSKAFKGMVERLDESLVRNYRIELTREDGIFDELLCNSNLLIGTVSTTILDCELSGTPTVLFYNPSQDLLISSFESVVAFSSANELIRIVKDVLYHNYRPQLKTGHLRPFQPDRLTSMLKEAAATVIRRPPEEVAVAISRYLVSATS